MTTEEYYCPLTGDGPVRSRLVRDATAAELERRVAAERERWRAFVKRGEPPPFRPIVDETTGAVVGWFTESV